MKALSVKPLAAITAAILVIGFGAWYSRSATPSTVNVNVTTTKITERKCADRSLTEQIAAADLILTGEVFVVLPDEPDALVYIKPITTYKGKAPTPLIIRAEDAGTIDKQSVNRQEVVVLPDGSKENELHFTSGQPSYLLFLRQSDNKFLTSRCDGSRLLEGGLTSSEEEAIAGKD